MYKEITMSLLPARQATQIKLDRPEYVYKFCKDMSTLAQEMFTVLTLNIKNKLIDRHTVSLGTLNTTMVTSREIFRAALMDNAKAIILVHNHPSGDPAPSSQDIKITQMLVQAGKIMAIDVLDHIIIGQKPSPHNPWLSLNESQLVDFNVNTEKTV